MIIVNLILNPIESILEDCIHNFSMDYYQLLTYKLTYRRYRCSHIPITTGRLVFFPFSFELVFFYLDSFFLVTYFAWFILWFCVVMVYFFAIFLVLYHFLECHRSPRYAAIRHQPWHADRHVHTQKASSGPVELLGFGVMLAGLIVLFFFIFLELPFSAESFFLVMPSMENR